MKFLKILVQDPRKEFFKSLWDGDDGDYKGEKALYEELVKDFDHDNFSFCR